MALAIDGSSPAAVTGAPTATTASFTPPSNSILLIGAAMDSTSSNPAAPSITDNLGSHLTYTQIDWQSHADSPNVIGQAVMWWALVGGSAAMTVSVTNGVGGFMTAAKVWVITGADTTTPIGAHGKSGAGGGVSSIAQNYTAQATNAWGFIAVNDDDALGSMTAGTGCTVDATGTPSGNISYGFGRRTTADDSNGGTNTLNINVGGSSFDLSWVYAELMPATTASTIPPLPFRYPQQRDYAEAPWIQKDRRNVLLVATAANPLVAPLDSAWQSGSRYWHLYGDSADAAPRTWQSLQRNYISNPSLLSTALLENELLGGGDTSKRYHEPATHVARWWMPEQLKRESTTPGLLDSALLEGPLLAGDTRRHYAIADYWDRREVPQQRAYVSDPLLLTAALLEGPLLAGDVHRHQAVADFWDRREVPQQRAYVSDPLLLTAALLEGPLLAGDTRRHYAIADYWDRREVPQQRAYVSDPLLLTAALLENELLGGADDLQRHRQWFTDRREVSQQLRTYDLTLLAAVTDPLTLAVGVGGDIWRRVNMPAYADRREVPWQPPRVMLYFDAGPGSPPLTLAWGAGGSLWHTCNPRRLARGWWTTLAAHLIAHSCSTARPSTGSTARPGSGTTARPSSGTTLRTVTGTSVRPNTGITFDPCE